MSLLSNLEIKEGSTKNRKRVGRGQGSGWGKQAAKGHKGQKARSGGKNVPGFEGGQMPLIRRIPKFGFTPGSRNRYTIINLSRLTALDGEVTPESLLEKGWLKKGEKLKILGDGEITKAINVKAHKFSASAKEAIEKAGGSVSVLD